MEGKRKKKTKVRAGCNVRQEIRGRKGVRRHGTHGDAAEKEDKSG
jgi:hypothetical protein